MKPPAHIYRCLRLGNESRLNLSATLAVIIFGLLVRLTVLLILPENQYSFGDSHDYQVAAAALCQGLPYPQASELPFFRPPGLPLFLAVATLCDPFAVISGRMALIFTDLLSIFGLIRLGALLGLSCRSQFLSGMAFSISPLLIGQTLDIQSEPLFQCLCIWLTILLLRTAEINRLGAGLLFSLASLTRPIAIGFLPLIVLGLIKISPGSLRKNLRLFLLGLVLAATPWIAANYARTGELILINDASGYNFWRGNHPIMNRIYAAQDRETLSHLSHQLEYVLTPAVLAQSPKDSPNMRSRFFLEQGIHFFVTDPRAALSLIATKCWVFLKPTLHGGAWSGTTWWLVSIWETTLYFVALMTLLSKQISRSMRWWVISYLLLALLLNLPFQVVTRFRVPLYEWMLILLAVKTLDFTKKTDTV